MFDEVEENNLSDKVWEERWARWHTCSLCEQRYHGVVHCALGWACWKTYLGRQEADETRVWAMTELGNGLSDAKQHEDALSVREAELATKRRVGESEFNMLIVQGNLANTLQLLGRLEQAMCMRKLVYSGHLKLNGDENQDTIREAANYASTQLLLKRFKEVKTLVHRTLPVARRVLGESHEITLKMRWTSARSLYKDPNATLDNLREAVTTLEDADRIGRRVLGGAHPLTAVIEAALRNARAALLAPLHARETPSTSA